MTEPTANLRLSVEDQDRLNTGDYVVDPVHGVVPKDVETARRLARQDADTNVAPGQAAIVVDANKANRSTKVENPPQL